METSAPKEKKQPKSLSRTVLEWTEELVIALIFITMAFTFLFRVVTVTGTSMSPNYNSGDKVVVTGGSSSLKQGDVVVIVNVLEEPIIKRVIAQEGQTVDFDYAAKSVLVDGEPLDETAFGLENGVTEAPYTSFDLLEFPQTVPEGCVFVLGDNRPVSEDSRYRIIGMVDKRNILGKAVFRFSPLGETEGS